MVVVVHAPFEYYFKVEIFNHKAIVMKPILVHDDDPALFHF